MTEEKEKIVQTTIRMPLSLHKRLTEAVHQRKYTPEKTSIDGLVQEAIRAMLNFDTAEVPKNDNDGAPQKNIDNLRTNSTAGTVLLQYENGTAEQLTREEWRWVRRALHVVRGKSNQAKAALDSNMDAFSLLTDLVDTNSGKQDIEVPRPTPGDIQGDLDTIRVQETELGKGVETVAKHLRSFEEAEGATKKGRGPTRRRRS